MSIAKVNAAIERVDRIADLKRFLKPGDTIYTKLNHVSRSGMYRVVDLYFIRDNEPQRISWSAAIATGHGYDRKHEGVKVRGCGLDVGFEAVCNLGSALFPGGFGCIGDKCPSNDHSNGMPRTMKYTKEFCPGSPCSDTCDHVGIPNVIHKDGGYALVQRWL